MSGLKGRVFPSIPVSRVEGWKEVRPYRDTHFPSNHPFHRAGRKTGKMVKTAWSWVKPLLWQCIRCGAAGREVEAERVTEGMAG